MMRSLRFTQQFSVVTYYLYLYIIYILKINKISEI